MELCNDTDGEICIGDRFYDEVTDVMKRMIRRVTRGLER